MRLRGFAWTIVAAALLACGCKDRSPDSAKTASPLETAMLWRDVDRCRMLIAAGADVNAKDSSGRTPLQQAVGFGVPSEKKIVELLLDNGADVNPVDEGYTPLDWAAWAGNLELVQLLVDRGADIHAGRGDPLRLAAAEGWTEVVEFLLNKGADVDAVSGNGWNALCYAAENDHKDMVELLLNRGAKIDAACAAGTRELLLFAARHELTSLADRIRACADAKSLVNMVDTDGYTPLHNAVDERNQRMVAFLIDCGADVNAKAPGGITALHWAALNNTRDIVLAILDHGGDVNPADIYGNTPLHNAASKGHRNLVELLVSRGADANAVNGRGFTPLDEATRRGHPETADLLRK